MIQFLFRNFRARACHAHGRPGAAMALTVTVAAVIGGLAPGRAGAADDGASQTPATIDFNRDIRPILSDNCFFCHGPDRSERKADLRLDTLEGATANSDSGGTAAIVPGNPEASEMIARIFTQDEDDVMPPPDSGKSLTAEQKDLLRTWVKQGAVYATHWAWEPPQPRAVPESRAAAELPSATAIDRFVGRKLDEAGLNFSDRADPVTLVRRLYFDLTGLPPSPSAVDAFAAAPDEQAWMSLVGELLSSPAYGERMATWWLDLVRYADTVGYHGDQDHNIAAYRDYVIDAFNRNMPLDRFSAEQLAGDLMPEPTTAQKIATGYNRLLQTTHEGGLQPKEYLAIYAADRVRNVSSVWLGSTLGCAQCHDHKYDPYTMKDFYSMAAFFADVDEARHFREGTNSLPTKRPPEMDVIPVSRQRRIDTLQDQLKRILNGSPKSTAGTDRRAAEIEAAIEELRSQKVRTMVTESVEPRVMRILPRGNWLDESGPVVTPEVPEFLGSLNKTEAGAGRASRLDLAGWLFAPGKEGGIGELTARVFANRIWYMLTGRGISESLEDFGGQGSPPTHPELLDFLALEFMESGWDIRHLIRTIVQSHTYRQDSVGSGESRQTDPLNRLFSRQSRYRVPAEMIRDTALEVSGLLVHEPAVTSIRPYQPDGYYRHLNFPERTYQHDTDRNQWKRAVYMHWQRMFLHPMLKAFDAPTREECTARRPRSNTPLASLTLLNDPAFIEAARHFAGRTLLNQRLHNDRLKITWMFRQAVSRSPDPETELPVLTQLLADAREYFLAHPGKAEKITDIGLSRSEWHQSPAELAAWTQTARAILNLNETYQRN